MPNYGQNDHLPNYGHIIMVKGHDDNNEDYSSGITSKTVFAKSFKIYKL